MTAQVSDGTDIMSRTATPLHPLHPLLIAHNGLEVSDAGAKHPRIGGEDPVLAIHEAGTALATGSMAWPARSAPTSTDGSASAPSAPPGT